VPLRVGDENVGHSVIAAGWAKCRTPGGEQASNYEDLARAEQDAQVGLAALLTALLLCVKTHPGDDVQYNQPDTREYITNLTPGSI
jgi:hypothetical protein